jgi:hypothetical protein
VGTRSPACSLLRLRRERPYRRAPDERHELGASFDHLVGEQGGALSAALGVLYRQTDQGGDDGKLAEMHCKTRRRGHSYKLGKRGERLLERAG